MGAALPRSTRGYAPVRRGSREPTLKRFGCQAVAARRALINMAKDFLPTNMAISGRVIWSAGR